MKTDNDLNNELIASFLGWRRLDTEHDTFWRKDGQEFSTNGHPRGWDHHTFHLEFHASWDWLMPVVEKISGMYDPDYEDGKYYDVEFAHTLMDVGINAPIAEVYHEVLKSIHWYNEQKKTLMNAKEQEKREPVICDRNRQLFVKYCYPEPNTGCWLWSGQVTKGYGRIYIDRTSRSIGAHRFSYILANGQVPPGLSVLHKCDVPLCVNPDHLYAGTVIDNAQDKVVRGRQPKGVNHYRAKLNPDAIREIRSGHIRNKDAIKKYGVCSNTVLLIKARKIWKHVEQYPT